MSTGQTLLTLGAFVLLSTILVTFYRLLAESGQTIDKAQTGITAVSLATTYTQLAQGLSFDEATIDSFLTAAEISHLTPNNRLGRDNQIGPDIPANASLPREDRIANFDDFDDFNNYVVTDTTLGGTLGRFRTQFRVYYVLPTNVGTISTNPTFVKRMDMRIWRISPYSEDTLRFSMIYGYFQFTNAQ